MIATRKGRRFASLPELDLNQIDSKKFFTLLDTQVTARQVWQAVKTRVSKLAQTQLASETHE